MKKAAPISAPLDSPGAPVRHAGARDVVTAQFPGSTRLQMQLTNRDLVHASERVTQQRSFAEHIGTSPRARAQGQRLGAMFGAGTQQRGPAPGSGVVQRKLVVAGTDYSDRPTRATTVDQDVTTVVHAIEADPTVIATPGLQASLIANSAPAVRQLHKWIENTPGVAGTHPLYGRKQQDRNYPDWVSLAQGLVGWVQAKPGRRAEKAMANAVYANTPQEKVLNSLMVKLYHKVKTLHAEGYVTQATQTNIEQELTTSIAIANGAAIGHYQKYHAQLAIDSGNAALGHQIGVDQLNVLCNPHLYSLKDKILILHDMMEYFGRHQAWNPVTAGADLLPVETAHDTQVSTALDPLTGARTASQSISTEQALGPPHGRRARGMGLSSSTRDETSPNTQVARGLNIPLWAGQSLTTVRMLKLAEWAGADTQEHAALALGLFAYWRKDYDHRAPFAYHTLFEVMDMAKNFNVDYRYVGGAHQSTDIVTLASATARAQQRYQELVQITQQLIQRVAPANLQGPAKAEIQALFDEVKALDAQVKAAHALLTSAFSTDAVKHHNLHEVLVLMANAAEKQKQITRRLTAMGVA